MIFSNPALKLNPKHDPNLLLYALLGEKCAPVSVLGLPPFKTGTFRVTSRPICVQVSLSTVCKAGHNSVTRRLCCHPLSGAQVNDLIVSFNYTCLSEILKRYSTLHNAESARASVLQHR